MIKHLVRSYLINIFALWVAAQYISGFHLAEGLKSLLIIGLGFTVLHLILKPILKLFLGAISFLTLGLIDLVIDGGILYLLTLYFPQISLSGWTFPGFSSVYLTLPSYDLPLIGTAIVSALVINVIRSILASISA